MVIKNAPATRAVVASSVIHIGSTSAVEKHLGGSEKDPKFSASKLLEELRFKDDRASDYRVYFNAANFNERDTGAIQFIYVGYGADKKPIYVSIGFVQSDFITLETGAVLNTSEGVISWHKGGSFKPEINSSFNKPDETENDAKLEIMPEEEFIKTSLSYIRDFQDITHVDLNTGTA